MMMFAIGFGVGVLIAVAALIVAALWLDGRA